jgi:hypothetical protein
LSRLLVQHSAPAFIFWVQAASAGGLVVAGITSFFDERSTGHNLELLKPTN